MHRRSRVQVLEFQQLRLEPDLSHKLAAVQIQLVLLSHHVSRGLSSSAELAIQLGAMKFDTSPSDEKKFLTGVQQPETKFVQIM